MTTEQFAKLQSEGKITSDMAIEALLRTKDKYMLSIGNPPFVMIPVMNIIIKSDKMHQVMWRKYKKSINLYE